MPETSAHFGILGVDLTRLLCSGTELKESKQHFVTFCRKRVDGARADFGVNAIDERLLQLGCQHRVAERLPPGCEGSCELFEKMLDAAFATAQMIELHVAHQAPAQARPPAQCGIHIGGADDAFRNKIVNLPSNGGLQPIGDMSGHLFA